LCNSRVPALRAGPASRARAEFRILIALPHTTPTPVRSARRRRRSEEPEPSPLVADRELTDRAFDQVYPRSLRELSREHWTPVRVARRAAQLLAEGDATSVLDVGSGPGKFCIVGALTTSLSFTGVERRRFLVDAARAAAARFRAPRVRFCQGNVVDFDFSGHDGFYLFNPFFEQVGRRVPPIDAEVGHSEDLYRLYVTAVERKLASARPGTAVVTYHGFGGDLPDEYDEVHTEETGDGDLTLWKKR
jgi:SAM-dependent methyltransferase